MFRAKTLLLSLALALSLLLSTGGAEPREVPDSIRQAVETAVASVHPALVRIHVVSAWYGDGREIKAEGTGSGVIITKEGHILSNHHVAGHATRLVCTLSNNEEIEAELVGSDALSDISVIKLLPKEKREFPTATFGNSDDIKVGDYVLAMGSPMALSQSVTLGIISNTKMVMPSLFWPFDRFTLDGEDVGSMVRWIGHDADIYGGNSGGPLVNLKGEVIGINEIRMGLSGAIPGNLAREVGEALIRHGKISRSWIGLGIQPLLKHDGVEQGVLISGAISDSPAAEAGFEPGDILMKLDGEPVSVRFREEIPLFNRRVADLPVGKELQAVVLRDGEEKVLTVKTIEREEMLPKEHELKPWGITTRDISFVVGKEMKLEQREGALITSIRPGGPCGEAKPMILPYDVIDEVEGTPIKTVADLQAWTAQFMEGREEPAPVLVRFRRKTQELLTVVKVGIKDLEDPGLEAKKAWLPVDMQVITRELARQLGQPEMTGMRITQVYPDSMAEQAGLEVGDLITHLDGESIPAAYAEDYEVLPTMIRQYRIGKKPDFTIIRGDEELVIPVELVRSPKLNREMKKHRDENFEFTVRNPTFFDKNKERWEKEQAGALVTEVESGGWAAIGHLGVGDLILEVDGKEIRDVDALEKRMKEVTAGKPKAVVLKVLRGIYTMYLELEPQWEETDEKLD